MKQKKQISRSRRILVLGLLLALVCGIFGLLSVKKGEAAVGLGTWKMIKKHYYFVYGSGEKAKGITKLGNKKYYFNSKGQQKGGWLKINGSYYYFRRQNKEKGYMVKGKTVNNIKLTKSGKAAVKQQWKKQKLELMVACQKIINKITNAKMTRVQKQRAAYDYERKHFYVKGDRVFHHSKHWDVVYARRIFYSGHGACYEFGALYAYLAAAAGGSKCASVSSGGHGWAECDGYCSDPNWEFADKSHSYFRFSYSLSGVGGRPNYRPNRRYVVRV